MMLTHRILSILIVLGYAVPLFAQIKKAPKPILYFNHSNAGTSFQKVLSKAGDRNAPYFTERNIDSNRDGKPDLAFFTKEVNRLVPNMKFSGILTLDWEGKGYDFLKNDTNIRPKEFDAALQPFIQLIRHAKKLRPQAKWGFWDMPSSIYWVTVNKQWTRRINALDALLKECDVLLPSLYDYYPSTEGHGQRTDPIYLETILRTSLEKGVKLKKPVVPYIWHRYHDVMPDWGNKSIDPMEFEETIQAMLNIQYKGQKISGVVWWHEDKYLLNIQSPLVKKEQQGASDSEYMDNTMWTYYNILKQYFTVPL